jgi:hypothetical protein
VSKMGEGPLTRRFARLNKTDRKPVARKDELVVEELGEELLVYDQSNDTAHSLGVVAARVWRACDGETSAQDLSARLDLDADTVTRALEELDECNLLDNGGQLDGVTRREATLKGAKIGAGIASAPLIYSILAPTPALAASQAYCLGLSGCTTDQNGCGVCHKAGCSCCGPGSTGGPGIKFCTADCTTTNCSVAVATSHCGFTPPSVACNSSDARLKRDIQPLSLDLLG